MKGNKMSEYEALEAYDDFLDEVYGDVRIGGLEYSHSNALKNVDPIAYRCGFNDWTDAEGIDLD